MVDTGKDGLYPKVLRLYLHNKFMHVWISTSTSLSGAIDGNIGDLSGGNKIVQLSLPVDYTCTTGSW